MPGVPTGVHATAGLLICRSVAVMVLIFSAAHGWKGIGSWPPAPRSRSTLHALALPIVPANHTPERSTWPSAIRGDGPPGGSGSASTVPLAATTGGLG